VAAALERGYPPGGKPLKRGAGRADTVVMDVFVTRQPIFDRHEEIAAYELLFQQPAPLAASAAGTAPVAAGPDEGARLVVLNAALGIGLDQLTGELPAFVSATRHLLASRAFELLDPRRIVVQIALADVRDAAVRVWLDDLYLSGYHLALEGFPAPDETPLLADFEYVKVHVAAAPPATLAPAVAALRGRGVRVVADSVPDRGVRDACLAVGIDLFQGLFSRPETIRKRDLSIEHIRTFHLMKLVRDVDIPEHRVEEEFRSDVSLTFKLLKIVNSAAVGGRGVRSIGHAIRLLGREALARWLGLLLLSNAAGSGIEREMVQTALVRARWCELLADAGSRPLSASSLYMVGLLSFMDRLLGTSVEELLGQMDLAPEVRGALLGHRGPFGQVLALAESYEAGHWDEVLELAGPLGISSTDIPQLYLESVGWAREHTRHL